MAAVQPSKLRCVEGILERLLLERWSDVVLFARLNETAPEKPTLLYFVMEGAKAEVKPWICFS